MSWVWTDELVQRLDADEPRGWVPLIAYRVGPDEDLDLLARLLVLGERRVDTPDEAA